MAIYINLIASFPTSFVISIYYSVFYGIIVENWLDLLLVKVLRVQL